jgi:hypothetical protein
MTKKKTRKLALNRETLRDLSGEGLREVHGGANTDRSICNCPILSVGACATRQYTNCTTC